MKTKFLIIILVLLISLIILHPIYNYSLSRYGSNGEEVKKFKKN